MMRSPVERFFQKLILFAALVGGGCAVVSPAVDQVSPVSVTFVQPDKFTDAKYSELDRTSPGLLAELEKFMQETGERYLPAGMKLDIRVTDIDLAGDFEPFRGPQFDHVRIAKGLYPPRIGVEFRLVDSGSRVVKEGKRDLGDIDYQSRPARPQNDYLRYEKDILSDWFRSEFTGLKG